MFVERDRATTTGRLVGAMMEGGAGGICGGIIVAATIGAGASGGGSNGVGARVATGWGGDGLFWGILANCCARSSSFLRARHLLCAA